MVTLGANGNSGVLTSALTITGSCSGLFTKADGTGCASPVNGQAITPSSVTISSLSAGNCMQAGTGGLLTTVSGPCSTGGTVTSVNGVAATLFNWVSITGGPVTTSGSLTFTPTAGETSHEVIGTCGALTQFQPCALVGADLPAINLAGGSSVVTGLLPHANIAATAVTPGSYTSANITVAADGSITAAANGSGGGGSVGPGTTNGIAYFNASTTVTSPTPPSTNGQYLCGYTVTASATVVPTCPLVDSCPVRLREAALPT